MIKEVKNIIDANRCDELLTELILDERKYNDSIDEDIVIKDHFNQMLNDKDIVLLGYYLDQEIVGYILIRRVSNNTCLLDGLYVLARHRNQGIGKALINEAINKCKELNVKYVDINVIEKNEVAKKLYKNLNFTEFEVKLRKKIL
ncbi:MAG: GNAT family N-acetyltransferase [Firmicutes bacterium]|nr:GNAT family N-acetyltransferase [Bacillota bacterium]